MLKDSRVNMVYCEPDRNTEENGYAESATQTVEIIIQHILMADNLPPSYWQAAAAEAEWILNRFHVDQMMWLYRWMVIGHDQWR